MQQVVVRNDGPCPERTRQTNFSDHSLSLRRGGLGSALPAGRDSHRQGRDLERHRNQYRSTGKVITHLRKGILTELGPSRTTDPRP
jgi:hypothetical protein